MSIKAGGSWSGNTFTATMSAFNGKITKAASITATATIEGVNLDSSMYNDEYAVFDIVYKKTVNGSSSGNITVGFTQVHVRPIAEKGWKLAAEKVSYSNGSKSVTVPKAGKYDDTESLDISKTYNAGWNACRAAVLDSDSTGTYYSGTITTKYDAPTGGAQARSVIYPYNAHTIHFYDIPDPK